MAERQVIDPSIPEGWEREQEQQRKLCVFLSNTVFTYTSAGVLLNAPRMGMKDRPDFQTLMNYMQRKRMQGINRDVLYIAWREGTSKDTLIATVQEAVQVEEEMQVLIAQDQMSAYIVLLPPDTNGQRLTAEDMQQVLFSQYGIVTGIDEQALHRLETERPYGMSVCVATGENLLTSANGYIEWRVNVENAVSQELMIPSDDGRFQKSRYLAWVGKDEIIGKVIPPVAGTPGMPVRLPELRNVSTPNASGNLVSQLAGAATLIDGKLSVAAVKFVDEVLDKNIEFDGHVFLATNVLPGLTVRATGSIVIGGMAERAKLIAGGHVLVMGSFVGGARGLIQAGGAVFVRQADYCTILCEKDVITTQLIHCNVRCRGRVDVTAGKGIVIGGNINAGVGICTRNFGTPGSAHGLLCVDSSLCTDSDAQLSQLSEHIEKINVEITRQSLVLKNISQNISPERRMQLGNAILKEIMGLKRELSEVRTMLERKSEQAKARKAQLPAVVVSGTLCENVSIQIEKAVTLIREECEGRRFVLVKNQIRTERLENENKEVSS